MNILLIGPQGSGKGTQAELLQEKFGLFRIETGKVLRVISKRDDNLGREVSELIDQGKLIPDDIIMQTISSFFTKENLRKGILFDGFPRILSQAKLLENELAKRGDRIDGAIFLKVSLDESVKRLSARRYCPKCKRIYNLLTIPPKKDNLCDICQEHLIARTDDTPEAIKKRLQIYEQETVPVIEYFKSKNLVMEIDGARPIEVIFEDIVERLKKRGLVPLNGTGKDA